VRARERPRLTAALATDAIWAQFGWWEASYNHVIDADVADPISDTVALRSHLCDVRPVSETSEASASRAIDLWH